MENSPLGAMVCDLCCNEPRFCRDCCCILCCKTVDYSHGGYSYIRCEEIVEEGGICAHIAHLNCALRSYMAGKVGGSIGLDAEYYCRRCDAKTDLVPHVTRLLQTCKSIDSRRDIEKILKVGISILRGSERTGAKRLFNRIELAIRKVNMIFFSYISKEYLSCFSSYSWPLHGFYFYLFIFIIKVFCIVINCFHQLNCGTCLEDIWKVEDDFLAYSTGKSPKLLYISIKKNVYTRKGAYLIPI